MYLRRTILLLFVLLAGCGALAPASSPHLAAVTVALARSQTPTPTRVTHPLALETPTVALSAPLVLSTPSAWRFMVIGDTRTAGLKPPELTYQLIEQARQQRPDLVLATGDLIKALGTEAEVREQWRIWREALVPLKPVGHEPWLLVTPGNHDLEGHDWATSLMIEAFPELPKNGPPGFEGLTYTFDYGGVRFISLHSEVFGDPHHLTDAQLGWLEQQLQDNPNRYTIVFSHDPAFPVGPHVGSALDAYPSERDRLWQLLQKYRVTAYIAGHEHLYNHQRIAGIDQLIVGTSGSAISEGYGGAFYHYLVGEVDSNGITILVYDSQGNERERFTIP